MWKEIKGYENYEVSDTGLVRNNKTHKVRKSYIGKFTRKRLYPSRVRTP